MNKINSITIARIGNDRTVKFAASELRRYLKKLDSRTIVDIRLYDNFDENRKGFIWLGMSDKLADRLPEVPDKKLDDAILIDVTDFTGVISGTNERSVLIAVYRFLRDLGVVWLCPGDCGENVPKRELEKCEVKICEAASSRHRVICSEGACSEEHLHNMIDWIPKAGMNGFFSQFFTPMGFVSRWYEHTGNPYLEGEKFTRKDGERVLASMSENIADRGIMFHMVGHGWTSEPFGIPADGWNKGMLDSTPPEILEMLAMMNGKRDWNGCPADTNLCYSNTKVIETIANAVAEYSVAHPELAYTTVWLADMRNNHCECEKCIKSTPSDLYINVLNRIDEIMTERGYDGKIIYISYNETCWTPLYEKLKNPSRFVLQFAPINRRFEPGEGYFNVTDLDSLEPVARPEHNKVLMPRTIKPIVRLMRDWLDGYTGDTCVYDYHLHSTTLACDPGGMSIAEMVFKDMCDLKRIGINGMVSCQVMRASFPNGLAQTLMARGLWNNKADYETEVVRYLTDCYGSNWATARAYLEKLSEIAAYWPHWDEKDSVVDEAMVKNFESAIVHISEYKPIIEKLVAEDKFDNSSQKYFWRSLEAHTEMAELICKMQIRKFKGETAIERADVESKLAKAYCMAEPEFHETLDVWRNIVGLANPADVENNH